MNFKRIGIILRWIHGIGTIIVFALAGLIALVATADETNFAKYSDGNWMFYIAFLFLAPFVIYDYNQPATDTASLRFLNIFRRVILAYTVIAGVIWYIEPSFERLEPLLFVFATITVWLNHLYNRRESLVNQAS